MLCTIHYVEFNVCEEESILIGREGFTWEENGSIQRRNLKLNFFQIIAKSFLTQRHCSYHRFFQRKLMFVKNN